MNVWISNTMSSSDGETGRIPAKLPGTRTLTPLTSEDPRRSELTSPYCAGPSNAIDPVFLVSPVHIYGFDVPQLTHK